MIRVYTRRMAKEAFILKKFSAESREIIDRANSIIANYMAQGLKMTLRQLYYQFVSVNAIRNDAKSYKRLASIVSDARLAGELDWDAIEDRGRRPMIPEDFDGPSDAINSVAAYYRSSRRWKDQPLYSEVWVEKEALAGVLWPVASTFHVPLVVNKGYSSSSALYGAAKRIVERCAPEVTLRRKPVKIFYIGDHDPSGEDMVRDVESRLNLFAGPHKHWYIHVRKTALTTAQVEEYNPPPNPAKSSDSRYHKYQDKHGDESWEVDALPPQVLQRLVRDALEDRRSAALHQSIVGIEKAELGKMRKAAKGLS